MEFNVEEILKENNIAADANTFNQHFIKDEALLRRIVDAENISTKDVVLEIGAGIGNLTEAIADKARFVHSIEIDTKFKPILDKISEKHLNLSVIYGNAMKIEWPKFNKLVSAIPYNIAEPLLLKLIFQDFESAVLVVSKHFSDLITSDNESRLSAIIPAFFKVIMLEVIPSSAFYPQPKVDSVLLVIKPIEKKNLEPVQYLLGEIFKRRYKKLKNSLMNSMIVWTAKVKGKILTKRKSKEFIKDLKLEPELLDKLVDSMSGNEFKFLSDHLKKRIDGIYAYCG